MWVKSNIMGLPTHVLSADSMHLTQAKNHQHNAEDVVACVFTAAYAFIYDKIQWDSVLVPGDVWNDDNNNNSNNNSNSIRLPPSITLSYLFDKYQLTAWHQVDKTAEKPGFKQVYKQVQRVISLKNSDLPKKMEVNIRHPIWRKANPTQTRNGRWNWNIPLVYSHHVCMLYRPIPVHRYSGIYTNINELHRMVHGTCAQHVYNMHSHMCHTYAIQTKVHVFQWVGCYYVCVCVCVCWTH